MNRVPGMLRGLHGIFINCVGQARPYLFSRRAAAPRVDGELRFLEPVGWGEVEHSCNGLVLYRDGWTLCVCNPATRRWKKLPKQPKGVGFGTHLVFDPTVSLHYELHVWVLSEVSESRPMPGWELKHKSDIEPSFRQYYNSREDSRKEIQKSWSLDRGKEGSDHGPGECGWDSSDESFISAEGEDEVNSGHRPRDMMHRIDLLGYHPSKDIAFFGNHFDGFAYNLGSSKLQYLGTFDPVGCCHYLVAATHESFIYTPCMDDLLPDKKRNTRHGE
ncbi:hypothetical protein HU200_016385 [Digitaria exilis]|uniref:F-box protein n=1 Tax=Digitaria exilis TaxID=1010633 RepID=A0A835F858_9POAL|nr:hypothetical protein HU200_016385 [Digitaria exilis]